MFGSYLWFCRVLSCCTRTMGAVGTRPSLRPLDIRGRCFGKARARCVPRERKVTPGGIFDTCTFTASADECALSPCGRGHRYSQLQTHLGEGFAPQFPSSRRRETPHPAAFGCHPLPQGERVHRLP